jgi:MOSC domain-containing protein YiiM
MKSRAAIKHCLNSYKTGFYFRVIEEGELQAGDIISLVSRDKEATTVEETHRLYFFDKMNVEALQRAVRCTALTDIWRDEFLSRLADLGVSKI